MKHILIVLICLPVFVFSQDAGYTIKGNIKGSTDGMKVYLKNRGVSAISINDSTTIKDGHFILKGKVETPLLVELIIDPTPEGQKPNKSKWKASRFYLENGDISYSGDYDKLPSYFYKRKVQYEPPVIEGSATQDENIKFKDGISSIKEEMQKVDAQYNKVYHMPAMNGEFHTKEGIKLANQYNDLHKKLLKYTFDYIHGNPATTIAFDQASYMLSGFTTTLTVPQINDLVNTISKEWKGTLNMKIFLETAKKAKKTAIGIKYQDFQFQTPDGKKVMLSQLVPEGKVVLLEFWASWCGPCRAEIPHLKYLNDTKSDEFSIVSISLDQDDASWKKAMKEEGMIWTQLVDYKGFEGEIAKAYNIFGIPHSLLLDGNGRIIKVGLRGAFLDAYLEGLK